MADPVDVWFLLGVDGLVVVEAIDGAWEAGFGGFVGEAEDSIEVGFFLVGSELAPTRVGS